MGRVLIAALLITAPLSAQTCDRVCLRDFLDQYFAALVKHDPARLPLSTTVRFTEDGVEIAPGEGLWKTASGIGSFRQDVLDVRQSTAGTHAIVLENGKPVLFALRMKIFGLRIHELETAILRTPHQARDTVSIFTSASPQTAGDAQRFELLEDLSRAFSILPPKEQRHSREELVNIANRNFVDPEMQIRVAAVDEDQGIVWQRITSPNGNVMWMMSKLYGGLFHARHVMQWSLTPGKSSGWD